MIKAKNLLIKYILVLTIVIAIVMTIVFVTQFIKNKSYAESSDISKMDLNESVVIENKSKLKQIDLNSIITQNQKDIITERIEKEEHDIEYNTQYRKTNSLTKGAMQTIQEGQTGKGNAIIKKIIKNGEQISEQEIYTETKDVAVDKIIEIGTGNFSANYVPIVGDKLEATSISLEIKVQPDKNSETVITIKKGDQFILKSKQDDWYNINYETYNGWIPIDCAKYVNPNSDGDGDENNIQYTRDQLTQDLGLSMILNKKSGLSLSQFKKIFEDDSNDKNKVFKDNAEYFYYVEQQYGINGIFVAAVGIHESGWGTSEISKTKKNLFGYGAYDRDPSGCASTFETYSEGIDLVSRVFMKYYLTPPGTTIFGSEVSKGTYFKGATLTAVNKTYASDKNWANCVFKWMTYLYNKL